MSRRAKTTAATGLLVLAFSPIAGAQDPVVVDPAAPIPTAGTDAGAAAATPSASPTSTPTPTPEPEPELDFGSYDEARPPKGASKEVKRVYRDFRKDSLISSCRHTLVDLRETRDTMPETFEHDFPDFLPTLQAAIDERRSLNSDECAQKRAEEDAADNEGTATPTPTPTATATPKATPAPTATATPAPTATAAPSSDGDPLKSVGAGDLPDVSSNNSPAPLPATTPAPVATPAPPAPPAAEPAPAPAPEAVATREPASAPAPVWGLAAGGGLLALGGLIAPLAGARPGSRLAGFRHSWGEAGFRLRGAWLDFLDWLRVGR